MRGLIGCGILVWVFCIVACLPAWVTHVIRCIQTEQYLLLVAGAIAAPIGVIHGWGIWLGLF